ncbi:origin of replication complex subunit 3 isoform X2 [Malania oleifera]|uniref:origin of replication complex subunit 3 isoform X2 n=1 Tax=Malania oleifera TaxID=397392 RepID=UPI0025AE7EFB|nr:origin of replication complex subunit 3 isoform X2 [Malania oleifera]
MPPSATVDSPSPSSHDNQENNLQPFFVLHRASARKPERKWGKARRRIDLSPLSYKNGESWEADKEGEGDDRRFEHLRMEAFQFIWSKIESTIKDVLRNMNTDVFNEIYQWVRESFNAIRSRGTPALAEAIRSYPVVTDAASRQLFTGLVLTKNMEFVDDLLTFEELGLHLMSNGCQVANLSSLDFSAKNGIGGCLRSLLRQFLNITVDAAEISILATWYYQQGNNNNPVVVIIDDLERCCASVLSDFIFMLRNILLPKTLQRLRPSKFVLGSPAQRMDAIVESVLVKPCSGFSVGYKVAVFMRNYFLRHDGTLTSFIRALKISCIQHFSTEPLSFMLRWSLSKEYSEGLLGENCALLREAMLKKASDLPSCRKEMLEQNEEDLVQRLLELERSQKCWGAVVLCLHEAGRYNKIQLLDLLCEALNPDVYISRASQHHSRIHKDFETSSRDCFMHQLPHSLNKTGFISQAIRKVRDLPAVLLHQLITSWKKHTEDVFEIHDKVIELLSLKFEDGKDLKKDVADISKRCDRRHASQRHPFSEKASRVLNEKAAAFLEMMVRDYMQPVESIPFHEIVCFRNVDKLQSALIGDPRKIIQLDLLEFHKILHCSCCSKNGNILLPSMHDTSIMYTLALEHGDLINLHDWYKSFKSTILRANTKQKNRLKLSPSPKKRKGISESQSRSEASIQAQFCRAVTELQIAGLLRMPSKRRPDYVQRVAFGL